MQIEPKVATKEQLEMSNEEWAKAGSPEIWNIVDVHIDYEKKIYATLYYDIGYGKICIVVAEVETCKLLDVEYGHNDFVVTDNHEYVGLGSYYGFDGARLFKKCSIKKGDIV